MDLYGVCRSDCSTALLRFEPLALAHTASMFEMADRPGYNETLTWRRPASIDEMRRHVEGWIARRATGKHASYAMTETAGGSFAGRAALTIVPEFPEWVAMTCELHPAFWGGAYALEATMWMQWMIFDRVGADVALAYSSENNVRSRRFLTGKAQLLELPLEPSMPSWLPQRPDGLITHINTRRRFRAQFEAHDLCVEEHGVAEAELDAAELLPSPAMTARAGVGFGRGALDAAAE